MSSNKHARSADKTAVDDEHRTGSGPGALSIASRAALIGTVASVGLAATLGALARREGRSAVSPINASSHVLHGDKAGGVDHMDTAHTVPGIVINHAAAIFWAIPFTWWLSRKRDRTAGQIALGAVATSSVAGIVDYGLMPRRLTPGWEHAVSPRAVATGFGALALGLAVGGIVTRSRDGR